MADASDSPSLTGRTVAFVVFLAVVAGFIGGFVGGLLTGDVHVYIDSFTGPGHFAGEIAPEDSLSE